MRLTAPKEFSSRFKLGSRYEIRVNEIKEMIAGTTPEAKDGQNAWRWDLIATWADTEGHYAELPNCKALISQKEREPLQSMQPFLLTNGIPSCIFKTRRGYYELRTLGGVETMAKFIKETEPYIRTENKKQQIARFKEQLSHPGRHESVHRRRARQILGIEIK